MRDSRSTQKTFPTPDLQCMGAHGFQRRGVQRSGDRSSPLRPLVGLTARLREAGAEMSRSNINGFASDTIDRSLVPTSDYERGRQYKHKHA